MATFKPYLGITQYNSKTYTFKTVNDIGEALTRFSANQAGENFDSMLNQVLIKENDYVIKEDSDYIIFSFSLSRSSGDKMFSSPYVSLSVSGRELAYNDITDTDIYTYEIYDSELHGSDFLLQWDASNTHAIGRVRVSKEKLKTIGRITHVFIAVADDSHVNSKNPNAGESAKVVGKYFALNEEHDLSIPYPSLSIIREGFPMASNKERLDALYQITEYNEEPYIESTPMGQYHVAIAPATISNEYAPIVYGKGSTNFKSDAYYGDRVSYEFKTTSNMIVVSDESGSYIHSNPSKNWDVLIQGEDWEVEPITVLHGAYLYTFNFNNKKMYKYTKFFEHTRNEEVFSKYFIFSGERYRTKFEKHEWSKDGEIITLKRSYVHGTCQIRQGSGCPFSFEKVDFKSDGLEYVLTLTENGVFSDNEEILSSTFGQRVPLITNLFFNRPELSEYLNIPLQDEYKYYHMGHQLQLKKNGILSSKNFAGEQEVVKYHDCELSENRENTFLIDISTVGDGADYMNQAIAPIACTINYSSFRSSTPINDYFKSGEQLQQYYLEEQNQEEQTDGAYFEYKNFVITDSNDVDLTNQVCIWNKNKGYVVFHCRDFSRLSQTNVFNTLKIQDGKLIYKINAAGIGDYNDDFSINQFINYCIGGNHIIGLSNFGRDEIFQVYHGDDLVLTLNDSDNEAPYTELLKLFYTDITNYLPFSIGTGTGATIDLTIKYIKPKMFLSADYTIFEIQLEDIPIVSGTRPLAFRRGGIIVNPQDQNEILDGATAERINLILGTDNTGTAIEINAINVENQEVGSCKIEYRNDKFYFDGFNLQELQYTIDDTNHVLTNKIDENTQTIATILQALQNQKLLIKSGSKDYDIYQASLAPEKDKTGSDSISITMNETIPDNAIIHTLLYTTRKTGVVGQFDVTKGTVTKNGNTFTIPYSYIYDCYAYTDDSPNSGGGQVTVVAYVIVAFNSIT